MLFKYCSEELKKRFSEELDLGKIKPNSGAGFPNKTGCPVKPEFQIVYVLV